MTTQPPNHPDDPRAAPPASNFKDYINREIFDSLFIMLGRKTREEAATYIGLYLNEINTRAKPEAPVLGIDKDLLIEKIGEYISRNIIDELKTYHKACDIYEIVAPYLTASGETKVSLEKCVIASYRAFLLSGEEWEDVDRDLRELLTLRAKAVLDAAGVKYDQ